MVHGSDGIILKKKAEEGYYINNKRWGIWTEWYESGEENLKESI